MAYNVPSVCMCVKMVIVETAFAGFGFAVAEEKS